MHSLPEFLEEKPMRMHVTTSYGIAKGTLEEILNKTPIAISEENSRFFSEKSNREISKVSVIRYPEIAMKKHLKEILKNLLEFQDKCLKELLQESPRELLKKLPMGFPKNNSYKNI